MISTRLHSAAALRGAFRVAIMLTSGLTAVSQASAAQYPVVIDNSLDRLMSDLAIPANAGTAGMWSRVISWPLVGLHISVLPTGQILTYGGTATDQDARTLDVWSPANGLTVAAHTTLANAAAVDSFCGSGALQANGQQLLTGGSSYVDNDSSLASSIVTPSNLTVSAVSAMLASPRWYATMTTLPDGRDLISGGGVPYVTNAYANPDDSVARNLVSMTPEIYTAGQGWRSLTGASDRYAFGPDDNRWWYPHQWVMPNGTVFGISATNMWSLDPNANGGNGSTTHWGAFKPTYSNTSLPNIGPTSTATMYRPGQILQVGGNGHFNGDTTNSSPAATVFDLRAGGAPAVHETAAMTYPRQWANSTVLPNGKVVVTGGTTYADDGNSGVYAAEIWDPATEKWTVGANAAVYRGYHSSTTLLPDGALFSSGGGLPGPYTNLNAEIYYPPYLFTQGNNVSTLAPRPALVSISSNRLTHGGTLNVEMDSRNAVSQVVLMRLGMTTHSFNSAQAYVPATFSQSNTILTVTLPSSTAIAPPGYYQVIALNANGVPSRGAIIALGAGVAAPPAAPNIVPAIAAPFTSLKLKAIKVAVGKDNSAVYIDPTNQAYVQKALNGAWAALPGRIKDVAIVSQNSIWAIGMDDNVYHWTGGNAWTQAGVNVSSIAASSDGTIMVTNLFDRGIWYKTTDDNTPNWQAMAKSVAKRVAVSAKGNYWMIGLDDNVYHGDGTNWVGVGVRASAISATAAGGVAVLNEDFGAIWVKNVPGNDGDTGWTQNPGVGNEFAWRGNTNFFLIDAGGTLASR